MKKLILITGTLFFLTITPQMAKTGNINHKNNFMIRHTVVFKLKHPKGSPEEKEFLKEGSKLALIPGVNNFESLRQISPKNEFDYGFSMEFDSQEAYEGYNNHPDHIAFVQTYWMRDVTDFMEIDYEPLK